MVLGVFEICFWLLCLPYELETCKVVLLNIHENNVNPGILEPVEKKCLAVRWLWLVTP